MADSNDINTCNEIRQRRKQMVFTVPPVRYELISPYPNYSQEQLDMRRKAEILEYGGNKQASKGNNLTKKQKQALALSGKTKQTSSYATIYSSSSQLMFDTQLGLNTLTYTTTGVKADSVVNCPIQKSSSRNAGVPGPEIELFKDPSVPLYNYKTNTNALGIENQTNTDKIRFSVNQNIAITKDVSGNLFTLSIQPGIDQQTYNFEVNIPFSYTVEGVSSRNLSNVVEPSFNDISFNIGTTPFSFFPLFNESLVTSTTPVVNIVSDISGFTFDLSNSDFPQENVGFRAIVFGGMINISNLSLSTENGYVYDFKILPTMDILASSVTPNFTANFYNTVNGFKNIKQGILFNISSNYVGVDGSSNLIRASLDTQPSTTPYSNFNIVMIDSSGKKTTYVKPFSGDTIIMPTV